MNADSHKGFAVVEKRVRTRAAGHGRGHPPTRDKGENHNAESVS